MALKTATTLKKKTNSKHINSWFSEAAGLDSTCCATGTQGPWAGGQSTGRVSQEAWSSIRLLRMLCNMGHAYWVPASSTTEDTFLYQIFKSPERPHTLLIKHGGRRHGASI